MIVVYVNYLSLESRAQLERDWNQYRLARGLPPLIARERV